MEETTGERSRKCGEDNREESGAQGEREIHEEEEERNRRKRWQSKEEASEKSGRRAKEER